ncbi:sugar kinase [Asanoa ishikariensis]|uniref:Glucokinase n=1 Tax=Asanoa ishikariensis TaxID=137265 RepID=A0A1H3UUC8_9ACTN|nr:ROK family protein [Asanoa ishikariensis]GIF65052.1 sugar kinase [Asanoa ishikariensis]SDZ66033.1 glucokinase [Asanoa ishikariensis]
MTGPDEVVVALDVGGTVMKCGLVTSAGLLRHAERHPTNAAAGGAAVAETILDVAAGLADTARANGLTPVAAGLAVPGVVDEERGVAVWAANVGFRDLPLRDLVADRLGLPTALGHDVRAGGVAEARLGAGTGERHVLFVAIGTGIAAAHVVDGRAFAGAHGAAGEVGHVIVRPGGAPCGCGARGCMEAESSASALARRYTELAGAPLSAAEVAAAAAGGDPLAVRAWDEVVAALADGLTIAQTLFDPAVIVIGGGLAEAGAQLLDPLGAGLRARLTFQREPALVRAALGDAAGCLGAGLLGGDALEAA